MQSSTGTGVGEAAPTLTEGVAAWSLLCAKLRARAALDAEIVALTGAVARSGTIEAIEGVTLDASLNLVHRLPASERGMLLTAADVLADMPFLAAQFRAGQVSWGIVRGIVAQAKRLTRAQRAALDAQLEASPDRIAILDPDDLLDAVAVAVAELRDPAAAQRSEDRAAAGNFIWAQPGLLDRGKIYGELDNVSLATVLGGVDALTPPDDGRSLAQRRADGLTALAAHRCTPTPTGDAGADTSAGADAGDAGTATRIDPVTGEVVPARRPGGLMGGASAAPAFDVCVDLSTVSVNAAGMIVLKAPGCLPVLSARVVDALAADATVRAVLFDGARPLIVTKKVTAKSIPADVRAAVKIRDRGDRFPGARGPIEHLHHTDPDTGHSVDHLVGLQTKSHRRVHRHGWRADINPDTAAVTWTRRDRTWTTLPRGTRLRRPPPNPGDDDPPAQ